MNAESLRATVEKLVSFKSRFVFSEGNAQAADWIHAQFEEATRDSASLAKVGFHQFPIQWKGRETTGRNVFVTFRGRSVPGKAVVVGAHYDSANWKDAPPEENAPGANDDGSGTAAVISLAREFAQRGFDYSLICVAFSAEELGLLGSAAFVPFLKECGVEVVAMITNDMIGNIVDDQGVSYPDTFRVYSAENSRRLARLAGKVCAETFGDSFKAVLHDSVDRPGRGGDHKPFSDAGIPSIRLIETGENVNNQHTVSDSVANMDFAYLEKMTRFNASFLERLLTEGAERLFTA